MALKYGKKKTKNQVILYSVITALLLSAVFLAMVGFLYNKATEEAYENLHEQTKQVKDDIILQLTSDRENLATMANFAAKLYSDGDDYSLLFESFKPIGMIENIGILNPDNTFSTKAGTSDASAALSFEEEQKKGVYISGRVEDITKKGYELIRSAVPITVNDKTVGILYGVIKPDKLGNRYLKIVTELDAQLFVYEKESGDILIDTVQKTLGNISFLKNRKYSKGYSYKEFISTDKGFTAFESAYRNETLHLHYSTIDEFDWMIAMGRYDDEVLAGAHTRALVFTLVYIIMLGIILAYIFLLMANEKKIGIVTECASSVRKELLETTEGQNNIQDALVEICKFAKSRSAIFFDTDGQSYFYINPQFEEIMLDEKERNYFRKNLVRYASELHEKNKKAVNVLCIKPDAHMLEKKPQFHKFLEEHGISEVSLSATINSANHITVLAVINPVYGKQARAVAEKVSACFSMALYNKNYLDRTIKTATTDPVTGTLNRVAYKNDIETFEKEQTKNFACVYVDLNELHLCNNKYGHAAGDAMLIYVANSLKEAFYGQSVYRIGGDEFLVFAKDVEQAKIEKEIELFYTLLKRKNYTVALGMSYRTLNTNINEMIKEAEMKMYEEKARYYQSKEGRHKSSSADEAYLQIVTGIHEIDTMLSVLKESYNGIYRVSLSDDKASRILMPAYLNYNENEEDFSSLFTKYVDDSVKPDYHRAVLSFLNYDTLKTQLKDGIVPKVKYKKSDGETVTLSVHKIFGKGDEINDTLWVFAKD